ncbi:MAG: glycosyltransferase [Desulfuromonadaceae bacterium]|nr:glycosyltransferase [Desulfuromonadaceae bacterium]MDD2854114.1 glycosyltransferase [Desulfuromonadaceae bacterium]
MKVLVIVPDVGRYGGTRCFLERLLDIHARHGLFTTLLAPTDRCNSDIGSLAVRYGIELVLSHSRTLPDTRPVLTPFFDFLFIWRTVLVNRPDLIVVSTGDPGRLSIPFYFPIPVIYILHTIPERCFKILPKAYLSIGSRLGNCVVAVSHAAAESVSAFMGIPPSRVEVVYNSCSVVAYRNEVATPIILTVGHLVSHKNPELWFEVACRVISERPNTIFIWLGDGELLEAVRKKVKVAFLEKNILLLAYQPNPSKWYAQAQIYFQPSLRESHGIAVLEAMAFGLPCVVTNIGGLPESVVDGETGYVCSPIDPAGLVYKILKLLDDKELSERMGLNGKYRCANSFSETVQEQKIIALYKRLSKLKIGE